MGYKHVRGLATALALVTLILGCATNTKDPEQETVVEKGRIDQLREVRDAIAQDPNNANLHYTHGNLLFDLGMYGPATQAYQDALRHNPNMAKAYTNLGLTLRRLGQPEAARGLYLKALEIDPSDTVTWRNLLALAQSMDDTAQAGRCLEKLASLDPTDLDTSARYTAHLLATKQYEKAALVCKELVRREPTNIAFLYDLGRCQYHTENWVEAESTWRRLLDKKPAHPPANRALAVLYWRIGSHDRAWQTVQRCIEQGISLDRDFIADLQRDSGRLRP